MSGKAVVVGASIAGLAAARVLSDRYGSVVVLEHMSRYNRAWPPVPSEVEFVSVSRPTLELVLRERVAELFPVAIREGVTVTALTVPRTRCRLP